MVNFLLKGAKVGLKKRYIFGVPLQLVEKVCFFKKVLVLYPYKNALWALRLCNRGRLLSVRPAPTMFDHLYASLHKAFGRSISASLPKPQTPFPGKGAECGPAALTKQGRLQSVAHSRYARKHKDSHTKPLHDATAQMAVNAQTQRHQRLTTRIGATPKARTLWLLAKSYKQGRLCQLNRAVARCNGTNS